MPAASMLPSFSLVGRTAIVTAASRGIGAAIVEALAISGANICIHYSSSFDREVGNEKSAETLAARCRKQGSETSLIDCDIRDEDAIEKIVDCARRYHGQIDIAVSNASVQELGNYAKISGSSVDRHFHVNFLRMLELAQSVLPDMAASGWGRFLAIGSVQQYVASARMPIYSATKAAQFSMVQHLAKCHAAEGVTVNSISPGLIATDRNAFRRQDPDDWADLQTTLCPMGRAGLPEDIQGAALLLCSDAGSYITGADIQVNGGMLLRAAD